MKWTLYIQILVCVCVWVGEGHTATWNQEKSNWDFICVKDAHKTTKINLWSVWIEGEGGGVE